MTDPAHARQCVNVNCRVLTYTAANPLPLATCPQCNTIGAMVAHPQVAGPSLEKNQ